MNRFPICALTLLTILGLPRPASAGYASSVAAFTPGSSDVGSLDLTDTPCLLAVRALDLNDALGPPDSKFVSVGEQGTISLAFTDEVVDGPSYDLVVWTSCHVVFCEPALLSVSEDGYNWTGLGLLRGSPSEAFDLSGISPVNFVKIEDIVYLDGECDSWFREFGFDVDAVEYLHDPLPTGRTTWGAVKALYRSP